MFSWVCPRCGREVSPSETECPNCKGLEAAQPAAPQPPQQPAYRASQQQPVYQAPPPGYPQPPQAYQPPPGYPPQYAPRSSSAVRLPTWLLTILFALAFLGLVAGVYWGVGYLRGSGGLTAAAPSTSVESPAAKPGAKTNPVQKYIEISGIRFTEDAKKKTLVKFNLTNHSDADLTGLAGNVTMWARTQKSEEDSVGTFSFSADVPPQATKEVTAPLTTKLKIYELPDWQNVTTDVQITAPTQ